MLELNTSVSIDLRPIDTALAITFAKPAVKPVAAAEPAEEFHLIPEVAPDAITLDGITFDEPAAEPKAEPAAEPKAEAKPKPVNRAAIIKEFKADFAEYEDLLDEYSRTEDEYDESFGLRNGGDSMAELLAMYEVGPALRNTANKIKDKFGKYRSIPFIKEKLDSLDKTVQRILEDNSVTLEVIYRVKDSLFYTGTVHPLYCHPAVLYAFDFWIARGKEGVIRAHLYTMENALKIRAKVAAAIDAKASK